MKKPDKKTVKQWTVVGAIIAIGLVLIFLFKKKDKVIDYAPLEEQPETVDDYLTYNQPPFVPGAGNIVLPPQAPINLGDTVVNVGGSGGNGNWNACKGLPAFIPMTVGSGGITSPPIITTPETDYTPSTYETIDVGKYIADCSIQTVTRELEEIAKFNGITLTEIFQNNLYGGKTQALAGWLKTRAAGMDPDLYGFEPAPYYVWFYDPDEDHSVQGKRVRYTHKMACECKRGRKQYCGRYLTPDMFKDVYVKKAS